MIVSFEVRFYVVVSFLFLSSFLTSIFVLSLCAALRVNLLASTPCSTVAVLLVGEGWVIFGSF